MKTKTTKFFSFLGTLSLKIRNIKINTYIMYGMLWVTNVYSNHCSLMTKLTQGFISLYRMIYE